MFDDVRGSLPPVASGLSENQRSLFARLPPDYRRFIEAHNGGYAEEFRYTFFTGVPFKTAAVDDPSRDDCPVEFFGFRTTNAGGNGPVDLVEIAAEHRAEEFLPRGVIAIARCVQNSLVCISLRDDDMGSVYYWDCYWRYPWCRTFFDARIAEATKRFDDPALILADRDHPQFPEVFDAINFATLVKLASCFSEWYMACEDRRDRG